MSSKKGDKSLDQEVLNRVGHEWEAFKFEVTHAEEALNIQFETYFG